MTSRTAPVLALLNKLNIPYQMVEHTPAQTMELCREADRMLGTKLCKNLLLCNRQRTAHYLLMMPDDKPFHTKDLSRQIGASRLSFAPGEDMVAFLNIQPGSLSVLGLAEDRENRVQLLIDRELFSEEYIGCHPCDNRASLKLKLQDITEIFLPAAGHTYTVVDLPRGEE